jgi:hypothetical protein
LERAVFSLSRTAHPLARAFHSVTPSPFELVSTFYGLTEFPQGEDEALNLFNSPSTSPAKEKSPGVL